MKGKHNQDQLFKAIELVVYHHNLKGNHNATQHAHYILQVVYHHNMKGNHNYVHCPKKV